MADAERVAGGKLVTSKLALITTAKDGNLTHRLILDCRVSGTNDHATKVERVILPSAWDVVHYSLMLKGNQRPNDVLFSNSSSVTSGMPSSSPR